MASLITTKSTTCSTACLTTKNTTQLCIYNPLWGIHFYDIILKESTLTKDLCTSVLHGRATTQLLTVCKQTSWWIDRVKVMVMHVNRLWTEKRGCFWLISSWTWEEKNNANIQYDQNIMDKVRMMRHWRKLHRPWNLKYYKTAFYDSGMDVNKTSRALGNAFVCRFRMTQWQTNDPKSGHKLKKRNNCTPFNVSVFHLYCRW